jgi:hypothetical protein
MRKPKFLELKDKKGFVRKLTFEHSLNLLRFEKSKGFNNFEIVSENYQFINNDIVRITDNSKDQETPE